MSNFAFPLHLTQFHLKPIVVSLSNLERTWESLKLSLPGEEAGIVEALLAY